MKRFYQTFIAIILATFVFSASVHAQYTNKRVKSKYQAYTDSLKNLKYNYVFPLLGQGAYSEGFDIPFPMGIMANYFYSDMGILINNFRLGFQNAYNEDNLSLIHI